MKRMLAVIAALMRICTLTACGGTESQNPPDVSQTVQEETGSQGETSAAPDVEEPAAEEESNVLVAYFSATGNTEQIAQHLETVLDADLYEIVPEEPYTGEDLNYSDDGCRANREQNDPDARPAIAGTLEHPENYDVVFLGYPIWWGQAPKIVHTFLESCAFDGVTIVPFCTSGSSGIGSSAENLHALAPNANWLPGQRFDGSASLEEVAAWVEGLELFQSSDAAEETQLLLTFEGGEAVIALEDNTATRELLTMLPATLVFEDFAGSEKISYLDRTLSTADKPDSYDPQVGDVALYIPWGNLAVFYGDAGSSSDLAPMGRVVSGLEALSAMAGKFEVSISVR